MEVEAMTTAVRAPRLRRWIAAYPWFGVLVIGGGAWLLFLVVVPRHGTSAVPRLNIMTYNIAGWGANQTKLLALMAQHQPDLVLLQEVRHSQQLEWLARHLRLPYQHFASYQNGRDGGVAMLSRWPLGPAQVIHFQHSRQGKMALAAQVRSPAGALWMCSVHLDSPLPAEHGLNLWQHVVFLWRELFTSTSRSREARELRSWLLHLSRDNWIVGGDFNTLPLSSVDRHLRRYFQDALSRSPWRYFTGTYWRLRDVPFLPRIDFLYHSPRWHVVQAQVIQHKASDHFPILAILSPTGRG
jgi:endonuclease/exonuclease/phosphatase (EEP) superfamily protein YafD